MPHFLVRAVAILGLGAFVALAPRAGLSQSNLVVRVLASNLTGDSQSYEPEQIRILKGLKPDIAAMQEFNYGSKTPADIRSLVDQAFGTNFYYHREDGSYPIPNGIVSRFPILQGGSWPDPVVGNRGFAWAQIDLPGTNDLYVVSVHMYNSGSEAERNTEAQAIKSRVQANFPADAWVIVAGDFNTTRRSEDAITTFKTFLSDSPIPTDAVSGGDPDTNAGRDKPYDYVLPSFSMTNRLVPVVLPSRTFPNGLVFDSRVYTPLSDVSPVLAADSGAGQHMAVVKDFQIFTGTNASAPQITAPPQSQTVTLGSNATFTVTATGDAPLGYEWRFYSTNLPGATATAFTVTNAQAADAGPYAVVATNASGSVTSAAATLTVDLAPFVITSPANVAVLPGQNANFSVVAGGQPPFSYQWQFNGAPITGATVMAYTRSNARPADAGSYRVVVTNTSGSVTSAAANLTLVSTQAAVIAQWNFNSIPPDGVTTTGATSPSTGSGSASLVGGVTQTFATGSLTDTASSDNSGWNTAAYPAAAAGNKTAGVRFNVSTLGWRNLVVRWDQRASDTASKYARLQYTTNGSDFVDYPTAVTMSTGSAFEAKTNSLAAMAGVNDNPGFGFRIVTEFQVTATGSGGSNYVAAASGSTYGTAGTERFDMVTLIGELISTAGPPAGPASLGVPAWVEGLFQFEITGTAGSNYVVQAATNLGAPVWIPLRTNAAPFSFADPNGAALPARYYRAVVQP